MRTPWRRTLQPQPIAWKLLPRLVIGAAGLVGDLAGVNAATKLTVTALLGLGVPAPGGPARARVRGEPFALHIGQFSAGRLVPAYRRSNCGFARYSGPDLGKKLTKGGASIDVKAAFDHQAIRAAGFNRWRL